MSDGFINTSTGRVVIFDYVERGTTFYCSANADQVHDGLIGTEIIAELLNVARCNVVVRLRVSSVGPRNHFGDCEIRGVILQR